MVASISAVPHGVFCELRIDVRPDIDGYGDGSGDLVLVAGGLASELGEGDAGAVEAKQEGVASAADITTNERRGGDGTGLNPGGSHEGKLGMLELGGDAEIVGGGQADGALINADGMVPIGRVGVAADLDKISERGGETAIVVCVGEPGKGAVGLLVEVAEAVARGGEFIGVGDTIAIGVDLGRISSGVVLVAVGERVAGGVFQIVVHLVGVAVVGVVSVVEVGGIWRAVGC